MRIPRRQLQPFTHRWAAGHPPVYVILIALNSACYVMQRLVEFSQPELMGKWLGLNNWGVDNGFVWQFITYTFLHGGIVHLLANMMLLFFTGRELEPLLGKKHFLGIYFGGGLVGGLAQWAFGSVLPPDAPLMGASACVLATLVGFTTILPELEITALLFFVIPLRMRVKYLSYVAVGSALFFILLPHFATASWFAGISDVIERLTLGGSHYAHFAHLGGCLLGWFYVKQLGYGNPWWFQRHLLDKRRQAERHKHMSSTQFIREEIDPILDKISREGIRSLSRSERRLLEMGRDKIDREKH
jgi:membrane associated rhomboid family serine protease